MQIISFYYIYTIYRCIYICICVYIYIYIFYIYVYIYSKIARCEICIVCNYIARCKVIQYLQESASFYELKNQREFILFKVSNTKTRIDCKIVMKRLSEHQKEVIRAVAEPRC